MNRLILFIILVMVFLAVQFIINCSNPLENIDQGDSLPADSIMEVDTVFSTDTLMVVDTLTNVDTVVIIQPGTGESRMVCSRIASNQREIVWMFRNQEGQYFLAFDASPESENPNQTLSVDIDGEEFPWSPSDNPELIKILLLEENATIRIMAKKPPSLGHAIHICLTVRIPEQLSMSIDD